MDFIDYVQQHLVATVHFPPFCCMTRAQKFKKEEERKAAFYFLEVSSISVTLIKFYQKVLFYACHPKRVSWIQIRATAGKTFVYPSQTYKALKALKPYAIL